MYAGNGIAGFERLVIIKHSSELLSAYSFNGKMLVAEQQQVAGGMVIAEIPRPVSVRRCISKFDVRGCYQPANRHPLTTIR